MWEMSGPKDDGRCQKAVRIVTELCRKKSLPSLDLDTCREFLLLPSDQSLTISEPGTVLVPAAPGAVGSAGRQEDARKGREMFASHMLNLGETISGGYFPLHLFHGEVSGASATSPVDAKRCNLVGMAGQMGDYVLVRGVFNDIKFLPKSLGFLTS